MRSTSEKQPLQTESLTPPHLAKLKEMHELSNQIDVLAIVFAGIGKFEKEAATWSDEVLAREINTQALHANDFYKSAIDNAKCALLHAWACGILLNTAKSKFDHGNFGIWRKQILDRQFICERTSQRYMLLAKTFPDVEALLKEEPSLRQAQIACRQSPEISKIEKPDSGTTEITKKQLLLSSVAGIWERLRQLSDWKEELAEEDKIQLISTKAKIDEFFSKILTSAEIV